MDVYASLCFVHPSIVAWTEHYQRYFNRRHFNKRMLTSRYAGRQLNHLSERNRRSSDCVTKHIRQLEDQRISSGSSFVSLYFFRGQKSGNSLMAYAVTNCISCLQLWHNRALTHLHSPPLLTLARVQIVVVCGFKLVFHKLVLHRSCITHNH